MSQKGIDLAVLFEAAGMPLPRKEVRFHPERKWRWDLAWEDYKVAFEKQGGTWNHGGHVRGEQYRSDCEKAAEGQIWGWLVIWGTVDMLRDGLAFQLVRRALTLRGCPGLKCER